MEYRKLPHGTEEISVIGLGTSSIQAASENEMEEALIHAVEHGVNYFDMGSAEASPFPVYGRTLTGCRNKIYYQIHFGADYSSGTYGWTTDLDAIKRSVDWQLKALQTDYIDFGMIHCIDEESDLHAVQENGVIDYILDLKRQGVVRHVGLSSHTPEQVHHVLDMGILDMLMFSINPAYDYRQGEYGIGSVDDRMNLYRRCEKEGVGISVMKVFGGGQLLNAKTSPFRKALTEYQCIQYVLDRPGVLTALAGIRGRADLDRLLGYPDAPAEARDYSAISAFAPADAEGVCVYCNHCQPCPKGLNIGLINKYYDLALAGDTLAAGHYGKLDVKADACVKCGHCNKRCPFHVDQMARLERIAQYFQ